MPVDSPLRNTLLLCLVEILGLASIATFPALLPEFQTDWSLTNTQCGWISAGYYGGYMISVPILAGVTDRIDARRVLMLGSVVAALGALGFAVFADGFHSALALRVIAGIGLAGIYMPGLKIVSDHTEGALQSRYVSFYTASFGIGASLSYLFAGEIYRASGWRAAFVLSALLSAAGCVVTAALVPKGRTRPGSAPRWSISDFRVVLRSRRAMAYILGYAAHMWELFSMRSWLVAFLVFSLTLQPSGPVRLTPTRVAFLLNLIGVLASIGGNETAHRFGRRRTITVVMITCAVLSVLLGLSAALPYTFVVALALVYGVFVLGDSAALTAGAVAAAPEGYRGATLALHSTLGFGAAFLGPLAVGMVLDGVGNTGRVSWIAAFVVMGGASLAGIAALRLLGPKNHTPPDIS